MLVNSLKKNKINLSDYNYEKDIECRKLMSDLSVFEVNTLTEIVHGSLNTTISQIAESVDATEEDVLPALEKLKKLKLFQINGDRINISKEMRKYYESQIPKFDNDFRADMEFVKGFLSKVPIHVLPIWYSIPRTSDDIFGSIIEKFLITPKIYQRYLDEISFDDPILNAIMNDVYSHTDYKIRVSEVIEKYSLTREQFEEHMLLLEFNLICCLSYNESDDHWVEVITPFYEWRQLLRERRKNQPQPINHLLEIERTHPHDFGFVMDTSAITSTALNSPIPIHEENGEWTLPQETARHILGRSITPQYARLLLKILIELKLVEIADHQIVSKDLSEDWLKKHLQEQAITIYRYGVHQGAPVPGTYINRDLREIETSLKRLMNKGWIYFDDFLKGCCAPIGNNNPVTLVKKGKRWKYELPAYSEEDIKTIHQYIFQTLFAAGFVATGTHAGKECFTITPFGRMSMD
ncbi:putative uncharacterized protein [Waddlia chondrophila 2032/99]|uniref:Uncharacterized protein n=1 Tax=Waddlia chondrophila 2032/99 TaxID=765953 RepID=F8LD32_9BACT|nr:putative uncharacterized protein [Waddlia chondrophila 2032/99]